MDFKTRSIEDITILVKRGIAPKYSDDGKALVLNQRCVRDGRVGLDNARRHDVNAKAIPSDRLLLPGDCLVNSTGQGTLGRAAVFEDYSGSDPVTVDSHVTIVRPDQKSVHPHFLGYALAHQEQALIDMSTGSGGQTELSRASLLSLEIALPPLDEQKRIVAKLDALNSEADRLIDLSEKISFEARQLTTSQTRFLLGEAT